MSLPQFGTFAQGTIAHEFIEFDIRPDTDPIVAARAIGRLRAPAVAAGGVNLVLGFGSDFWRAIAPDEAPADLAPFQPVGRIGGHHAPATQHDVWLWINGSSRDVVFEHARPRPCSSPTWPRWPPIGRASSTATAATSPGSSTGPPTRPCSRPRRRPSCPREDPAPAAPSCCSSAGCTTSTRSSRSR